MNLDLKPTLESKCKKCGKGKMSHNGKDGACPIGQSGRLGFTQFHVAQFFEDSGTHTIKSKRAMDVYEKEQQRRHDLKASFEREKAKVRAMTLEEVITATVEIIDRMTGLGVTVEREYEGQATIHVTNLGDTVRLGYTTVCKYTDGSYGVAGTKAGCFMSNHSHKCISNVLADAFEELENKANEEKSNG